MKQPEVPKPGGTDSKSTWAKTPPNSLFELLDGLLPTSMAIKGDENKQEVGIIGKKKKTGREQQQGDFPQRYLAELRAARGCVSSVNHPTEAGSASPAPKPRFQQDPAAFFQKINPGAAQSMCGWAGSTPGGGEGSKSLRDAGRGRS